VSLIALFDVLRELERGDLIRLLPDWYADAGAVSLYYASRTLIAAKTRLFVDFVVNAFKTYFPHIAEVISGNFRRLRDGYSGALSSMSRCV
jgi:DNA-binding transcriptional LysR family regulator